MLNSDPLLTATPLLDFETPAILGLITERRWSDLPSFLALPLKPVVEGIPIWKVRDWHHEIAPGITTCPSTDPLLLPVPGRPLRAWIT